jgi:fumarylacetoacetase
VLAGLEEAFRPRIKVKSWIATANEPSSDFPLENLPYGVFSHGQQIRIGVAIGDQILDLRACAIAGLLGNLPRAIVSACQVDQLNALMTLGPSAWSALRGSLSALLDANQADQQTQDRIRSILLPMRDAVMQLPAQIGDYTDFYASIHHATRVGKLFRPDSPLLGNYKYVPIGYHGRTSSIVVSGATVRRPHGQLKTLTPDPVFVPARSLDYELELGIFIGPGNRLGESIPVDEAEQHIFGLCLLNDWSARDIQSWEYQPLGPFLAKNFATTISPWIIPLEALRPYRVPPPTRAEGDPAPLPYLTQRISCSAIDLNLEVYIQSQQMFEAGTQPTHVSTSNMRSLYWTVAQLVAHHTGNGCNLRSGDLLATGTISGPDEGSEGCLLEMKHRSQPLQLPSGETRVFLEDGDRITFRAFATRPGGPWIGFGECTGTVGSAYP